MPQQQSQASSEGAAKTRPRSRRQPLEAPKSTTRKLVKAVLLGVLMVPLIAIGIPLIAPDLFIDEGSVLAQLSTFFGVPNPLSDGSSTGAGAFTSSYSSSPLHHNGTGSSSAPLTGGHTNNWAVLVCTSKFWFNYRHMANTLGMYRTVKRLGIPDSNIILMLADDAACNPRNKFPGKVWANSNRQLDLYGENVEVDYRGYEVSVENLIRVLTGRTPPSTPRSKRLESDARSNVFLYMTGHGGDEFLKFQDHEEISAFDIADAIEQMWEKKRYHELFFMVDTCQANTMYSRIYSPNVLATGSSKKGQNSYSHHSDGDLGVAMIDRFTNHVLEFMEDKNKTSETTMQDLFDNYNPDVIHSDPGVRTDLFHRPLDHVKVTDFFGGVAQVELTRPAARLVPTHEELLDAVERSEQGYEVVPGRVFLSAARCQGAGQSGAGCGAV
ncbi:uncharacterized protein PFL1_04745 [Pseudozyma flocculosa PF-1]|uniref:Related to GPI8 - GPI-anchor transamidase n=2 Tax=Pseudozyma flocculosa TaxID=84751 RepID=A0A5C3F5M2_9BASI|nr:uncharacterized protein PFL1_04745 [Pseudozyma flocculosa PF-1]EPQ27607.1 hypothetical protein PFL1_04745 [Pseudozyma flocculosa PF-1]SPO39266.1 related to GPI8 - GPI-anchor transamidase [Pseudozyma flocculosa]